MLAGAIQITQGDLNTGQVNVGTGYALRKPHFMAHARAFLIHADRTLEVLQLAIDPAARVGNPGTPIAIAIEVCDALCFLEACERRRDLAGLAQAKTCDEEALDDVIADPALVPRFIAHLDTGTGLFQAALPAW